MTRETYRRDTRADNLTLVVAVGTACGMLGALFLIRDHTDQLQAWTFAIVAMPLMAGLVTGKILGKRYDPARVQRIAEALQGYSMTLVQKPDAQAHPFFTDAFDLIATRLGLQGGIRNLSWFAFRDDLLIFEHSFQTNSGRVNLTLSQTVVVWLASNTHLPGVHLSAHGELYLRKMLFGEGNMHRQSWGEDLTVGSERFERAWSVYGNAEMAKNFLAEDVERLLIPAPRAETWWLAHGYAAASVPFCMRVESLMGFLRYTEQVLSSTARP